MPSLLLIFDLITYLFESTVPVQAFICGIFTFWFCFKICFYFMPLD